MVVDKDDGRGIMLHGATQYHARVEGKLCQSAVLQLFVRDQALRAIEEQHRSEEHTSELQSLMRISYAVFCLKKKNTDTQSTPTIMNQTKNPNNTNPT